MERGGNGMQIHRMAIAECHCDCLGMESTKFTEQKHTCLELKVQSQSVMLAKGLCKSQMLNSISDVFYFIFCVVSLNLGPGLCLKSHPSYSLVH